MDSAIFTRRRFLRSTGAVGALALSPLARAATAGSERERILVVLELSGGNDGLNTLVPYGDDAYYRHRPTIGIPASKLRVLDDHHGFGEGMAGMERLYKDGHLAIVHGCGYAQPSFSHFTSMGYWHTGAPGSGAETGWIGRLADAAFAPTTPHAIVNIDATQSLAVNSKRHVPVVFDSPGSLSRDGSYGQRDAFALEHDPGGARNATQAFLRATARSAQDASAMVREAWSRYNSKVDYGLIGLDLPKIAALIENRFPARLYYTSFRNNAFDTHVHQNNLHARLLTYTSDAIAAFMADLERIGRERDVTLLVFSEFGRRVPENANLGTDHGTANLMFVAGASVRGGHYGEAPSLTVLDAGDNLRFTTDFRRVYATMIEGWLGHPSAAGILGGEFETFELFA